MTYVRTPAPKIGVVVVLGPPGLILGRPGPVLAGPVRFLGLPEVLCEAVESLVERGPPGFDVVGVVDDERQEDGLVDEPTATGGERLVDDFGRVQKEQRVVKRRHDILDLAVGGVGPSSCLGTLGLDAVLLGPQDLVRDTAFVVELDELLLLASEFSQSPCVAG
jgi:hypothetical protein